MAISGIGRLLIFAGIALVALGLLFVVFERIGVPRLPGDIVIRRGNVTVFLPIATSILLSIVFTLLLYLFRR